MNSSGATILPVWRQILNASVPQSPGMSGAANHREEDRAARRCARTLLWLILATGLLFTVNRLASDWMGKPPLLAWELTSAFLLAVLGIGAIEVQKGVEEQQRVTGLTRELLTLQDALRRLDVEDFSTFFDIAIHEEQAAAKAIRAGAPMVLNPSRPMRRLWQRLREAGWTYALPGGSGAVGGDFTAKGRAGLPLLIHPVLREWQELGEMLEEVLEGEAAGRN